MNKNIEKKLLYWQSPNTIKLLENSIRKDFISVTSTDTILGFLANISKPSFTKLNEIKGERSDKPYLILISNPTKIEHFVDTSTLNENVLNLLNNCWPGPVTIIFKAKETLADFLTSKDSTIAIRCPQHKGLQKLSEFFDGLFSTSANKSGATPPKSPENVSPDILKKIEYIVIDKKEKNILIVDTKSDFDQTLPSTIIDLSGGKEVKVIRKGAYKIEELEEFYGSKFKK